LYIHPGERLAKGVAMEREGKGAAFCVALGRKKLTSVRVAGLGENEIKKNSWRGPPVGGGGKRGDENNSRSR